MNKKQSVLLVIFLAVLGVFFLFDLGRYLELSFFQEQRDLILVYRNEQPYLSSLIYFVLYVCITAFSLPAATLVTLAGGAIFGFWWALALVSFASTIGASLAFLMARTILRDWVQQKFSHRLQAINEGIRKDGIFYLFTLRLIPVFPFFLVNFLMALTPIRLRDFYWVSQLGMLVGTALYVEVGVQLGMAQSIPAVFSIGMLRILIILALFPWLAKVSVAFMRRRKLYRAYPRPARYDANLVVIGAGSAGLVTAYIAALARAKVILIEKDRMGGDCLNTGCVPSKALIRSAGVRQLLGRAGEFGLTAGNIAVDFPALMQSVQQAIGTIAPHDSAERYTALGVECLAGEARIISPFRVRVGDREITTRQIVIATGARPRIPDIPGLAGISYVTSETIWEMRHFPEHFLVLGAGPIGCELGQAFARLGSKVTLIDRGTLPLSREDSDASAFILEQLQAEGVNFLGECQVLRFEKRGNENFAILQGKERALEIRFDTVLLALGRQPNVDGLGLESIGVELTDAGAVRVDRFLRSTVPNILACGDVAGPYQFTHMAAHQAWYAAINSLFSGIKKFRVDYSVVPRTTFTDPELARVGLNEEEARMQGVAYEITRYDIADLDRAIVERENRGFVKVLTVPGKDRILGATIVGYHASELLTEFVLAMKHKLGLRKILGTIHAYPTLSESNKYVAGEWRKSHAPEWLYPWLEKFHRRRRK